MDKSQEHFSQFLDLIFNGPLFDHDAIVHMHDVEDGKAVIRAIHISDIFNRVKEGKRRL